MRGERQSLSNWRGAVTTRGEKGEQALVRRAMAAPADDDPRALTHGFHVYPARLHPHLARTLVGTVAPGSTVLDPFCGSGTVLVEALAHGCRALGRDINPLAIRIARLKTGVWSPEALVALESAAKEADEKARALTESRSQQPPPAAARRDFDPHMAWELAGLRDAAAAVKDARIREALLLSISSILVKVSRREGLTTDRHTDKHLPRGRARRLFVDRVRELGEGLAELAQAVPPDTPRTDVREGDARTLDGIADASVDLLVSSPPYAGTYRYVETSGISAAWLGLKLGAAARKEIGAKGAASGVAGYRTDMGAALRAARRVLKPGGRSFWVVADLEDGTRILPADRMMEELGAAAGFACVAVATQPRSVFGRQGVPRVAGGKNEHLVELKPRPMRP